MYNILTLNKIAAIGTSRLGDNYKYGDDVQNPDAVLVRSAAMHDMEFAEDSPFAAGREELRYGDDATEALGDVTYTTSDGSTKYLYPAFHYCKSIGCHMATAWEFERIAKSWKLDYSDAVNRSYYAVCGQHLPPASDWWLCGRSSVASWFVAGSVGLVDASSFFGRSLVLALSLSEI